MQQRRDNNNNNNNKKKNKSKKKNTSNYKGPDANGNYVSYQLLLKDNHKFEEPDEKPADQPVDDSVDVPVVSLQPLMPYLQNTDELGEYRLIFRAFRISQTRRRVRTMTQKAGSYIKKRRQKLLIKENATPSWQGIVMVVIGVIGCLLSILLAQIWKEDEEIARSKQHYKQKQEHQKVQRQRQAAMRRVAPQDHRADVASRYDASAMRTRKSSRRSPSR